ncbi:spermidine/putrescine transport system permease protein PotB [Acetobacter sp. CAG:977]|nr:spermidine/putrescine transport system permease protein PotB [Acetobacter sp. CAG:977]
MLKSADAFCRSAVLYFIFIWLGLMVFIPNLLVLLASFLSKDPKYFLSLPLNLENYKALFDTVLFGVILKSLNIAFFTTVFCLVVGYPFAYFIARAPKEWRSLFLMLIIVPFWTNSLIRNYALISILSTNGLLNTFLLKIGVISQPIQILYSDWAVFIGMSYTLLPFMILPLYATLEKLDQNLLEAARDLGAGSLAAFFKVVVPLSFPGIVAGCIMVFLPALSLFYVSDILGGANSTVVGSVIRNKFMIARDWPVGSAISVILTVFMLFLLKFYYKSGNSEEEQTIW